MYRDGKGVELSTERVVMLFTNCALPASLNLKVIVWLRLVYFRKPNLWMWFEGLVGLVGDIRMG